MSFVLFPSVISLYPLAMGTPAGTTLSFPAGTYNVGDDLTTDVASAVITYDAVNHVFDTPVGEYQFYVSGYAVFSTAGGELNFLSSCFTTGNYLSGGANQFTPLQDLFPNLGSGIISPFAFNFQAVIKQPDTVSVTCTGPNPGDEFFVTVLVNKVD